MKYPNVTSGQNEAVINKLGGMEGLRRFLADELVVVEKSKQISADGLSNAGITFAASPIPDTRLFFEEMAQFHGDVYDIVKLPEVKLPEPRLGFCWGLIMAPGITIEQDIAGCKKDFEVWRWTDDDLDVLTKGRHVRDAFAHGPYAIWFRDRVEADEELKNKSYNDLIQLGISGITLPERIRLERWFFWKTKNHLDIKNITLCSGSRYSVGFVPYVHWCGSGLWVGWCGPGVASGNLRAREVVS